GVGARGGDGLAVVGGAGGQQSARHSDRQAIRQDHARGAARRRPYPGAVPGAAGGRVRADVGVDARNALVRCGADRGAARRARIWSGAKGTRRQGTHPGAARHRAHDAGVGRRRGAGAGLRPVTVRRVRRLVRSTLRPNVSLGAQRRRRGRQPVDVPVQYSTKRPSANRRMSLPVNRTRPSAVAPVPIQRAANRSPSTNGSTSTTNIKSESIFCVSSTIACNSSGPFTSRFGQCPTKSAETSSATTGLPAHSSLIQRSYIAFAVVICTVYPTVTQTMRPCGDHEYRTQDVHFDAHHRAAEPKVRNAIPVKAPAITWLTRYSPPNSAAKSTVPATTAMPTARCHTLFGASRRG